MNNDNNKEEQPSTSTKESVNNGQSSDADQDKKVDDGGDSRIDSVSSQSSSVSVHSRLEMINTRHKVAKPATGAQESKLPEKKKKRRVPSGRIEKRLMPRRLTKRPMKRRLLKHRIANRKHTRSISTISTGRSSLTASPVIGCQYCGHRCCRRRYEEARKEAFRKRREYRKLKTDLRRKATKNNESQDTKQNILRSESVQAGSRTLMLSSLCENTNVSPPEELKVPPEYCDITPEMIYESMRRLTMWKQDVATMAILEYVKRNYPVCQDIPVLFEELALKLQVAVIVGFVAQTSLGRWRLCGDFQKRYLSSNHVTQFWITYVDTMKPVTKKIILTPPSVNKDEKQTSTKSDEGIIRHDFDVI